MNICVNTYEGFSVNAMGIRDILNHWMEGMIHFLLGGGTVKSFAVTEIIAQITERNDPAMGEMFKGWENGMKRRTVIALASGKAKDLRMGIKFRNTVGGVSAHLLLDR